MCDKLINKCLNRKRIYEQTIIEYKEEVADLLRDKVNDIDIMDQSEFMRLHTFIIGYENKLDELNFILNELLS